MAPCETLDRLQAKIETALVRVGLPPEGRKFSAHITLARLKSPDPRRLGDFLAHNGSLISEDMAIDQFTLYSSQLSSSGAIYRAEHVYPLKG
jgi:2'-5' RNA ligase